MKARFLPLFAGLLLWSLAVSSVVSAEEIASFTDESVVSGDPTQLGRLSRNGIPQDWVGSELFPGVINPTVSYHYTIFDIPSAELALTPFIQISMDSVTANTFASAYFGSYNPANLETNWLGDAGLSGNFFGVDPLFFQVVMPGPGDLILVVNNTSDAGLNQPFNLLVEGFIDTEFDDPPVTAPEPSSLLLLSAALTGLFVARRKQTALGHRV